jgi:hypothetical protein
MLIAPGYDPLSKDPNSLHPGQITVVPARLRPPADHDPAAHVRNSASGPVHERDQMQPVRIGGWVNEVDWEQLGIDHRAALARIQTVTDEPGDAAKKSALEGQAAALKLPVVRPTVEERVDKALLTLGTAQFANANAASPKEAEENLRLTLKHRHSRTTVASGIVKRIAAHKLGILHTNPLLEQVASTVRAQVETGLTLLTYDDETMRAPGPRSAPAGPSATGASGTP